MTRTGNGSGWGGVGRVARRAALLASAALLPIGPSPAAGQAPAPDALPSGGRIVAGGASISAPAQGQLTITQTTQRAAIDWQSFSVGERAQVQFQQPNSSAIALNRVTGPDASVIAGRISANGAVAIVSQSGVVFTPTARVDAGALIASAAGISNENFMAGRLVFDAPPRPGARVVNEGRISIAEGGLAALVAPEAANRGTIEARLGRVVIGGTETYAIDLHGDGLLSLEVRRPSQHGTGPAAANTGSISAEGGTVLITAEGVGQLVTSLVEAGGTVAAREGGRIAISATGGEARVNGRLDVSATAGRGGEITVTGRQVAVTPTARLDASGASGGGRVRVGGDAEGRGTLPRAERTGIAPGAEIRADSTGAGPGGSIVVWADDAAFVHGRLSARGGPQGGDGGFIETSAARVLSLAGIGIDTAAPAGRPGTWLIDPFDLTIGPATGNGVFTGGSFTPEVDANSATLDAATLSLALETGDVELRTAIGSGVGTGLITVAEAVSWTSGTSLTLDGVGGVLISAPISAPLGRLVLAAGPGGAITQSATGTLAVAELAATAPGAISLGASGNAVSAVTALAGGGAVSLASSVPLTLTANATAGASLALSAPSITAAGVTSGTGATLSLLADTLSVSGAMSAPGGRVVLAPHTPGLDVTLGGSGGAGLSLSDSLLGQISTGSGTIRIGNGADTGAITVAAAVTIAAPQATTLELSGAGDITQAAPLSVSRLLASGARVTLTDSDNAISRLGDGSASGGSFSVTTTTHGGSALIVEAPLAAAGALSLRSLSGGIDLAGTLTAGGTITLSSAGSIGQSATAAITAPALTLSASGAGATISLASASNAMADLAGATIAAGGGAFSFFTTTDLALSGPLTVPGSATLAAGGGLSQGAALTATTLTASAGAAGLTLEHPDNAFATLAGAAASGGPVRLSVGGPLTVSGAISGTAVSVASGGQLTTTAGATVTASTGAASLSGASGVSLGAAVTAASDVSVTASAGAVQTGTVTSSAGSVTIEGAAVTAGALSAGTDLTVTAALTATLSSATAGGDVQATGETVITAGSLIAGAGRTLTVITDTLSAAASLSAPGGTVAIRPLTDGRTITLGGTGAGLSLPAATLALVSAGSGTLSVGSAASGAITLAGPVTLTGRAAALSLSSGASVSQAGALTVERLSVDAGGAVSLGLAGNTIGRIERAEAVGAVSLASSGPFTIGGAVRGGSVTLTSGGAITIEAPLDAGTGTLSLAASGAVSQTADGNVTAGTVTGNASGLSLAAAANAIGTLGPFTATSGDIALATSGALILSGAISTPQTVRLEAGGGIGAGAGLAVSAARLSGSAQGGTDLGTSAQAIATLGPWSDTAGGLAMTTSGALAIAGDITLAGPLSLATGGALTQAPGTAIATTRLSGSSSGGASLAQPGNAIASLDTWTDATGGLSIATTGTLSLPGSITLGGTLSLAGSAIAQAGSGAITAPRVVATAPDGVSLAASSNTITAFGAVSASSGDVALATTGALLLDGMVDAGGRLSLAAGGSISQTAPVTAARLAAEADGAITLADAANAIAALDDVTAAGPGGIRLRTTSSLAIDGAVFTPAALVIEADGAVSQGAASAIEAATLSGRSSGGATLARAANRLPALTGWTNSDGGGLSLTSGTGLTVTGTVSGGAGPLAFETVGSAPLSIATSLSAGGAITGTAGGTISLGNHIYSAPAIAFRARGGAVAMTVTGGVYRASESVVFAASGSIRFQGTTRVEPLSPGSRPAIVISTRSADEPTDATRVRPDVAGLPDAAQFTQIERFGLPTGATRNSLTLGSASLVAPASPLFLVIDGGSATGTINVARLGVITLRGQADLSGCVNGVCGGNAASFGRSTDPSSLARLNNCPISSPNCVTIPTTVSFVSTVPPELPPVVAERRFEGVWLPLADVADEDQ